MPSPSNTHTHKHTNTHTHTHTYTHTHTHTHDDDDDSPSILGELEPLLPKDVGLLLPLAYPPEPRQDQLEKELQHLPEPEENAELHA